MKGVGLLVCCDLGAQNMEGQPYEGSIFAYSSSVSIIS